jgi:hypothetical protein
MPAVAGRKWVKSIGISGYFESDVLPPFTPFGLYLFSTALGTFVIVNATLGRNSWTFVKLAVQVHENSTRGTCESWRFSFLCTNCKCCYFFAVERLFFCAFISLGSCVDKGRRPMFRRSQSEVCMKQISLGSCLTVSYDIVTLYKGIPVCSIKLMTIKYVVVH